MAGIPVNLRYIYFKMGSSIFSFAVVYLLSRAQHFANPWTVAYQAPLSVVILQTRILEGVAISSSRGSS